MNRARSTPSRDSSVQGSRNPSRRPTAPRPTENFTVRRAQSNDNPYYPPESSGTGASQRGSELARSSTTGTATEQAITATRTIIDQARVATDLSHVGAWIGDTSAAFPDQALLDAVHQLHTAIMDGQALLDTLLEMLPPYFHPPPHR